MKNQNWVFGGGAGLNFAGADATTLPVALSSNINTREGCASISDDHGNLLLYTDGQSIWNGAGVSYYRLPGPLRGNTSSTQSSIIVPNPGTTDQFYIFAIAGSSSEKTMMNNNTPQHQEFLHAVLVDTALQGIAAVSPVTGISENFDHEDHSPTEKITAIPMKDCSGYWVITFVQKGGTVQIGGTDERGGGFFEVYKVDSSGVSFHKEITLIETSAISDVGYLKASPDGQTIAVANFLNGGSKPGDVFLFSFNPVNGEISNYPTIPNTTGSIKVESQVISVPDILPLSTDPNGPSGKNTDHSRAVYGVEFSPNNQFLYFSVIGFTSGHHDQTGLGYIFQVELGTLALPGRSWEIIKVRENTAFNAFGALQRGPDNRIYVALAGYREVGVIENPNNKSSLAAHLNWPVIELSEGSVCTMGLPNLFEVCDTPCDCDCKCDCKCHSCNDNATEQNQLLNERADEKISRNEPTGACLNVLEGECDLTVLKEDIKLEPCFYLYWGTDNNEKIKHPKTTVLSLKICNPFTDVLFKGLKVTKVSLVASNGDVISIDEAQLVPDSFLCYDCLMPCTCQTREIALIPKENIEKGEYKLQVEYCYDEVEFISDQNSDTIELSIEIG